MIIDAFSWLLLGSGSLIIMLAALLIVRMPTFFTRLHAASVNETLGPALILLGLMLQTGAYKNGLEVTLKLLLILVFLLLTSPVASHALAKAAIAGNVLPGQFNPRAEASPTDPRRANPRGANPRRANPRRANPRGAGGVENDGKEPA